MSWLPALGYEATAWRLPLSATAYVDLAAMLVARSEDQLRASEQLAYQTFFRHSEVLCHAALAWHLATRRDAAELSLQLLASWFAAEFPQALIADDPLAPRPSVKTQDVEAWRKLRQAGGSETPERLPEWGTAWLQIAGPTVPDPWKCVWPRLFDRASSTALFVDRPTSFELATSDLSPLARGLADAARLRSAFASQLEEAKREAVYQLAYGLSHEINNPLAVISARAQQLQKHAQPAEGQRTLQSITQQVQRAHEMIADLMFVARPPPLARQPQRVEQLVADVVAEFADGDDAIRRSIRCHYVAAPTNETRRTVMVPVDVVLFSEAIRAVVRNALEASPDAGEVRVEGFLQSQHWIIRVHDHGRGLTDRDRQHAFDPFYSSREAGRGLGMGLCRVQRIMQLHGGSARFVGHGPGCTLQLKWPLR